MRACAFAFAVFAASASAVSAADTLPAAVQNAAAATLTLSDVQLQVRALPGNSGAASVTFGADDYQHLEVYVIGSNYSTQFGRVTANDKDPSLNLSNEHVRAGGTLGTELMQTSVFAQGAHQPDDSYFGEGKFIGRYSPTITPFTEMTLSGRLFAEVSGALDDENMSYSSADMVIHFANQFYRRRIHLHGDIHLLDEEFSLTYRNDSAITHNFNWITYAIVNAPVPEPSQSMMLALGASLLGLFGIRSRRRH